MPVYTIQAPDGRKIKIEANDEATAVRGAQEYARANPVKTSKAKAQADAKRRSAATPGLVRSINQGFTFNLSDEIDAAGAALETGANNALSKIGLTKGAGYSAREAYDAVAQSEREAQAQYAQQSGLGNFAGNVIGGLANPLAKVGGNFVQGGQGLAQVAGRSAAVGGGLGALYGAGEGENLQQRGMNALSGGVTGAAVGGALPVLTKGAQKVMRARKAAVAPRKAAVNTLQRSGVDLTYGEMAGGMVKKAEDALSTVSGAIGSAKTRGQEQFNKAAINEALAPIGQKLDKGTGAGREAIDEMIRKTGNAIEDAYSTASFVPDEQFGANIKAAADDLLFGLPREDKRAAQSVVNRFLKNPTTDSGPLSGSDLSKALSEIGKRKRAAFRQGNAQLGEFLGEVEGEVMATVERAGTGDMQAIKAARRAYMLSLRPERAAGYVGAQEGVFSPSQLQSAVKANAGGARGRQFARGQAPMQGLSEAGKTIMSPSIGSSGTTERATIVGLAGSALAGNPLPLVGTAAAEVVLRMAYSKPVLGLVNNIARAQNPQAAQNAILRLQNAARTNPEAARALEQLTARVAAMQTVQAQQQSRPSDQANALAAQ